MLANNVMALCQSDSQSKSILKANETNTRSSLVSSWSLSQVCDVLATLAGSRML